MEYLDLWETRDGVKTTKKAIQNMVPLTPRKKIHNFIGLVKYYRDVWERRQNMLAPLIELTQGKVNSNGLKLNKERLNKLIRLWPAIFIRLYRFQ